MHLIKSIVYPLLSACIVQSARWHHPGNNSVQLAALATAQKLEKQCIHAQAIIHQMPGLAICAGHHGHHIKRFCQQYSSKWQSATGFAVSGQPQHPHILGAAYNLAVVCGAASCRALPLQPESTAHICQRAFREVPIWGCDAHAGSVTPLLALTGAKRLRNLSTQARQTSCTSLPEGVKAASVHVPCRCQQLIRSDDESLTKSLTTSGWDQAKRVMQEAHPFCLALRGGMSWLLATIRVSAACAGNG